jgi:GTP-binding protein
LNIIAQFVGSAAGPEGFPQDDLAEIALVGRSNVGKSSLINALLRQRVARTSAAPGKTRLVNVYRVRRGTGAPFYLVDLPGYGYARGTNAGGFDALVRAYFEREVSQRAPGASAILLVDARHPGLEHDRAAWEWLKSTVAEAAIVATKVDKLARGERIRALRTFESVFQHPALPVSATTGEGLDELWTLINRVASNSGRPNRFRNKRPL